MLALGVAYRPARRLTRRRRAEATWRRLSSVREVERLVVRSRPPGAGTGAVDRREYLQCQHEAAVSNGPQSSTPPVIGLARDGWCARAPPAAWTAAPRRPANTPRRQIGSVSSGAGSLPSMSGITLCSEVASMIALSISAAPRTATIGRSTERRAGSLAGCRARPFGAHAVQQSYPPAMVSTITLPGAGLCQDVAVR